MHDAMDLFDAVKHVNPVILTGLPRGNWAGEQKKRWAAKHFPGTKIITCLSVEKWKFAKRGDILVDDMEKHRHLWEEAGGVLIHHRCARQTLKELRKRFPDLFEDVREAAE
jgi:hypothetical protein